jgi:cytochrome c553
MVIRRLMKWVSGLVFAGASASPVFADWAEKPAELYKLCTSCHGHKGEGNQGVGAHAIAGLPEWYLKLQLGKFNSGVRGGHPRDINGLRMRPIGRTLGDSSRQFVAKYVSELPKATVRETLKGNLAKGEATFQVCKACHGAQAEGNVELGSPPLTIQNDWYLLTQLKNFKARYRGYDAAKDTGGSTMVGIAGTLDEAAMLNVVSYISTLKPAK